MNENKLNSWQQALLFLLSLLIVGFGQPAFSFWCSLLASLFGFALFWRLILEYPNRKQRFWISTGWFCCVQIIQLSWLISHPYFYIYAVLVLAALAMGMQFGLLCLFITPRKLERVTHLFALAGLWTLLEWSRLFILSGFSWNPIGMTLSANLYSLQLASVAGVFGLSFWVILVNLLALKAWIQGRAYRLAWAAAALLPFVYGAVQLWIHDQAFTNHQKDNKFTAILVQTAFPIEEIMDFKDQKSMIAYVLDEWRQILKITKKHLGSPVDLIVTPEYTVPYGTYSCVFPHSLVAASFKEIYGPDCVSRLPKLEEPFGMPVSTTFGEIGMVNNAYWAQALANIFDAEVVVGMEDAEEQPTGEKSYYSTATHFQPKKKEEDHYAINRYEKRVLVPMGEYIPSTLLKKLAKSYGIQGSFTPGVTAKIFGNKKKMGLSICYEETFGYIMRENKTKGAEILLNLTSDVWYPRSRLMQQHFDHARPRTVENGIPLLRACNTGITGAIDSLGRVSAVLGESPSQAEWLADSLKIEVPTYTYTTLYSHVGDYLILCISFIAVAFGLSRKD